MDAASAPKLDPFLNKPTPAEVVALCRQQPITLWPVIEGTRRTERKLQRANAGSGWHKDNRANRSNVVWSSDAVWALDKNRALFCEPIQRCVWRGKDSTLTVNLLKPLRIVPAPQNKYQPHVGKKQIARELLRRAA